MDFVLTPYVEIREETAAALGEYARVSIAFEVRRVLEVEETGAGGFRFAERAVEVPWRKDYDAIEGEHPARLAERFDLRRWGFLGAHVGEERVGGAILAFDTPGVLMLEGRRDVCVVWDLRVAPDRRRRGVGRALWAFAERWAEERGCREIRVETQNVNVPACRFYARQGCAPYAIRRRAYPGLPEEVQVLWRKGLRGG